MINKILEPEERVYIKDYSQAEFFSSFIKKNAVLTIHLLAKKIGWIIPIFNWMKTEKL